MHRRKEPELEGLSQLPENLILPFISGGILKWGLPTKPWLIYQYKVGNGLVLRGHDERLQST